MVEVRSWNAEDEPEGAWIMIEKRGGDYFVTGRQNRAAVDPDASFDTPEAAIRAATTWADLLAIPVLYVRDNSSSS